MKIEVKNLSKKFKDDVILSDINLTFESGNIYGLVGRNGSGKSVFLKMLCGFYYPTSGEILYDGHNYISNKEYPKDVRALIEKPSFMPDLSGFENLKLLAAIQNKISDKDIIKSLKDVNLDDERDKKYNIYSQGMRQKLGIAQVLMENPKVMILDEPFNGIEGESVKKIIKLLKELKKQDKIIIISSHIKEDIESCSDKIYICDGGSIRLKNDEK